MKLNTKKTEGVTEKPKVTHLVEVCECLCHTKGSTHGTICPKCQPTEKPMEDWEKEFDEAIFEPTNPYAGEEMDREAVKSFIANELRKEYARGQLDEITAIRQLKEPLALTQREDEIRKEIEGMKHIKNAPETVSPEDEIYYEGYCKAIDDILLRLSQGGKNGK